MSTAPADRRKRRRTELEELRLRVARFERTGLVGRLTASLTHELLQPVTAILGNAEACQRLIANGRCAGAALSAALQEIIESSCLAGRLINRVRRLLNEDCLGPQRVHLNRLVLESIRLLGGELMVRRLRVVTRLAELPALISCDAAGLRLVVLSLLMNCIDALGENPVADREILVTSRSLRKQVCLTISYCSRGSTAAPAEARAGIPNGGIRAPSMLCAEIVRSHEGQLRAVAHPGATTRIHLSLPLAGPGSGAPRPTAATRIRGRTLFSRAVRARSARRPPDGAQARWSER